MRRSFNPFTAYYLANYVRNRLHADLGYSNAISVSSIEVIKNLKDQLLTGPVQMEMRGEKRFDVTMSLKQYHEAICKRHFYGVQRIRRLEKCALRLLGVRWSSAWTLVTVYYSAYFSALELLEASGRHISYFSSEQASEITTRAAASRFKLTAGTYLGSASVSIADDEVLIEYRYNQATSHEFAWTELDMLVRDVQMTDPKAIRHQDSFRRFLGARQGWNRPNEVRNRWNYGDPHLFSEEGEQLAEAFMGYVETPEDVISWALGRHLHNATEHEASAIAYLQESLAQTIDAVAEAVLPETLAKQCALPGAT